VLPAPQLGKCTQTDEVVPVLRVRWWRRGRIYTPERPRLRKDRTACPDRTADRPQVTLVSRRPAGGSGWEMMQCGRYRETLDKRPEKVRRAVGDHPQRLFCPSLRPRPADPVGVAMPLAVMHLLCQYLLARVSSRAMRLKIHRPSSEPGLPVPGPLPYNSQAGSGPSGMTGV
jgi:hypothetical protein